MGPFATRLLQQSKFVDSIRGDRLSDLVVLDNACGTGVVSSEIMNLLDTREQQKLHLTCADISEDAIKHMQERIDSSGWTNARAIQADAMVRASIPKVTP